jgi:CRISPR system Cascade subunit CasA
VRFDLTAQPWVPVTKQGVRIEVSARDALLRAHEFDGLATDDPLQAVALFRQVLLPVVLHVFGVPRDVDEWDDRHRGGRFDPPPVSAYLDEYAPRFDLFGPDRPFAQAGGLAAVNGGSKPVSLLIPQLASGNNVPLFSARTENDPPALTPAQAARAVLSAQCWDTAAIKTGAAGDGKVRAGKTTGNPTGPLGQLGVVIPIGATLFETLMLSVPIVPQGLRGNDRPQWADDPLGATWEPRRTKGLLDLLTWQSRRIRLVPEERDGDVRIRRVVLCAGDRMTALPHDIEPHTGWKQVDKPKAGEPPQRPDRHQPGRSAWQGLAALAATRTPSSEKKLAPNAIKNVAGLRQEGVLPEAFALHALVVGVVYGTQSAVIDDVVTDLLPLPVLALLDDDNEVRATLLEIIDQAEELRRAANRLGDDLRVAVGADKMPWDRGQRLGELLVAAFTPTVRRLLSGLQRHPHDAERAGIAWRVAARRTALEVVTPALDAVPATAFLGRRLDGKSRGTEPSPGRRRVGEAHPVRLATAEAAFRSQLNKILGPPMPASSR